MLTINPHALPPPGFPAMPWPTAAVQPHFKPAATHPVTTATTGMLLPNAPPPHAYLLPQQPIYGAPLVWGSFGLPATAASGSVHQQFPSGLLSPVPSAVRASSTSHALQRAGTGTGTSADSTSTLVHKDENTGQISQKASSSLRH